MQSCSSYMDYVWIATEQADDGLGENKAYQRTYREKYCTAFDTEIEGFLHSLVQMGTIAETAERLEALSQSDDDSISEKEMRVTMLMPAMAASP